MVSVDQVTNVLVTWHDVFVVCVAVMMTTMTNLASAVRTAATTTKWNLSSCIGRPGLVQQSTCAMLRSTRSALWQIVFSFQLWKNFENLLRLEKVSLASYLNSQCFGSIFNIFVKQPANSKNLNQNLLTLWMFCHIAKSLYITAVRLVYQLSPHAVT